MKYLFIALLSAFVLFAYCTMHKATFASAPVIPNTPQAFFAAVSSGQIKFMLSDPFGIYASDGKTKIGYWTTDGSVYDMNNTLIAKGLQSAKAK